MQLLIDIKSPKDKKLFTDLASRLRLKTAEVSLDDLEDFAFGIAIEEGMKSGNVNKEKFMTNLRKRIAAK